MAIFPSSGDLSATYQMGSTNRASPGTLSLYTAEGKQRVSRGEGKEEKKKAGE